MIYIYTYICVCMFIFVSQDIACYILSYIQNLHVHAFCVIRHYVVDRKLCRRCLCMYVFTSIFRSLNVRVFQRTPARLTYIFGYVINTRLVVHTYIFAVVDIIISCI